MVKRIGSDPDHPYPAKTVEEAMNYSRTRILCPKCGKEGGHTYEGHATLVRKTATGENELFDVHCVKCGRCAALTAVFYHNYGDWSEVGNLVANRFCTPGSGCRMVMSSGLRPEAWLPLAFGAEERESDEHALRPAPVASSENYCGPVLIHSLDSAEGFGPNKNGCGHVQFLVIGPSYEKILQEILRTAELMATIHEQAECVVCGKPVKAIVIAVEEDDVSASNMRRWMHAFPCSAVRVPPGTNKKFRKNFSPEAVRAAETRVVYMSSKGS